MTIDLTEKDWLNIKLAAVHLKEAKFHTASDNLMAILERRAASPATPAVEPHPDDAAVDRFAEAMKTKMALSREKGRNGWDSPELCPADRLRHMLRKHIGKGDPVDVGNFCMMLWNRGESTNVPLAPEVLAAIEEARKTGALAAMLPDGGAVFINRGDSTATVSEGGAP